MGYDFRTALASPVHQGIDALLGEHFGEGHTADRAVARHGNHGVAVTTEYKSLNVFDADAQLFGDEGAKARAVEHPCHANDPLFGEPKSFLRHNAHGIGKREVDVNIICKNGALDEIEWAQMQKHPTFGLQILSQYDTSEAMKACCFEHHENFLGSGYPQGLSGEEIHPMARIIALTDTFDALTTQRSYNVPMSPKEALTFITEKLGSKYDPELLKAMNSVLFQMEEAQKAKA